MQVRKSHRLHKFRRSFFVSLLKQKKNKTELVYFTIKFKVCELKIFWISIACESVVGLSLFLSVLSYNFFRLKFHMNVQCMLLSNNILLLLFLLESQIYKINSFFTHSFSHAHTHTEKGDLEGEREEFIFFISILAICKFP